MRKHFNCVVSGCDSVDDGLNAELKFYPFPKEDSVKRKWLKAINRNDEELNKRSKVCSKHFKHSDYSITRFNYTVGGKNNPSTNKNTCEWKVLKADTVPSLHLPEKSTFKIKISKKDNSKEVKVEEVKVKEEKPEKVKMPKKLSAPSMEVTPVVSRSRRQASKEALKQMQILLEDEDDAVEIPSDDDIIPVEPTPPPPKKKYKLSHRKSSDGNERDVLVLKTITNRDAENTLELDYWEEQLEEVQKAQLMKYQKEEKELQTKLEALIKQSNAKVIHKGDLNTIIEVTEAIQAIPSTPNVPPNIILNNNIAGGSSYQLVMDPRLGLIVGAVNTPESSPTMPTQKVYPGKVTVAQNLQQTSGTSVNNQVVGRTMRTRRGSKLPASSNSVIINTPPQTRSVQSTKATPIKTIPTKAIPPAKVMPPAKTMPTTKVLPASKPMPPTKAMPTTKTIPATKAIPATRVALPTKSTPPAKTIPPAKVTPTSKVTPPVRTSIVTRSAPQQVKNSPTASSVKSVITVKKTTVPPASAPVTRARQPYRPTENSIEISTGDVTTSPPVVDLTTDDGKGVPDSREIAFNKLQGKTYPSLVVVARPHLRVTDLNVDRPKLDSKVKAVLMHAPTKFTEWLIQQGLVRSEQKCTVHPQTALKLGMYSDATKFPYSGGYVWISECCPQRFVSVFSGSLFEGSPHSPVVILKLLYHWACQTNIQNVTQWVKVDNLYVKGMYTLLRSVCTVALQTHLKQIGGPGLKVEVGVISLGTTTQDGNQRQVKVEVLGVLDTTTKLIRLRAVEPQSEGDRNYKKRFSKILEPVQQWVHSQSILIADLTVDKQTLNNMGYTNVIQSSTNDYGTNNKTIMEYLRRIVPRMFQNTLSLLSRQIIQQFLDELVWREWFGYTTLQAFDNLVLHLSEQTRSDNQSLICRLNKVGQNPFKNWAISVTNNAKPVENIQSQQTTQQYKKARNRSKQQDNAKQMQQTPTDSNRPPKSTSPDVPEQMVPLENYYYGTIDTYSVTPSIVLNMKCPFCKLLFDNNIQLMNHLFKHAHNVSQDAQLCRYCLTSVPTASDLLKHISSSHPAETKFDNGFVCLICETQYMNPFVLGKHMCKEHCPSELPYQCGTCGYRCSNHKQAIDHFYKKHDNGPTIQCPFCLKSTTVFSSSRNIVQNMNYFIQHLQKHQRKQFARRCGKCNLWFVQKDVLRDHQMKMHVSQRGKPGLITWVAPRNGVMVPKSRMDKYPGDADVINFSTLFFNVPNNLMCKECNSPMDAPKHFPSFQSCQNPNCQYSTCCTNAIQEHNAKCNKSHNPVAEEKLPFEMFCICNYSNTDGNQMARHLAICERKSAYPSKTEAKVATVTHSMLDVLGLVRKPEETKKEESVPINEESTPIINDSISGSIDTNKKGKKRKREDSKEENESETVKQNTEKKLKTNEEIDHSSQEKIDSNSVIDIHLNTNENKDIDNVEDKTPVEEQENTEDMLKDEKETCNADENEVQKEPQKNAKKTKKDVEDSQMDVEESQQYAEESQKDVEESRKDVEESQKGLEESQKDVEESQKDVEESQKDMKKSQNYIELLQKDVEESQKEVEKSQKDVEGSQKDVDELQKDAERNTHKEDAESKILEKDTENESTTHQKAIDTSSREENVEPGMAIEREKETENIEEIRENKKLTNEVPEVSAFLQEQDELTHKDVQSEVEKSQNESEVQNANQENKNIDKDTNEPVEAQTLTEERIEHQEIQSEEKNSDAIEIPNKADIRNEMENNQTRLEELHTSEDILHSQHDHANTEILNHIDESMEISDVPLENKIQNVDPEITSADIQSLISDMVGSGTEETPPIEMEYENSQSSEKIEDLATVPSSENMEIPEVGTTDVSESEKVNSMETN